MRRAIANNGYLNGYLERENFIAFALERCGELLEEYGGFAKLPIAPTSLLTCGVARRRFVTFERQCRKRRGSERMKFGWKTRVGLVLSAVWLCVAFLISEEYRRVTQVLGLGVLPLVLLWGIAWAVAGWRAVRPLAPQTPEAIVIERRRTRSMRMRTFFAVIAILAIGVWAATLQFRAADDDAGGNAIGRWVGEWTVYALVAYFVFRLVPKLPRGTPAVLAALVLVGAVNLKAYAAIAEDRAAMISLAKAAPLMSQLQGGGTLSDQQVRDARVGVLEPLMLAQATFGRKASALVVPSLRLRTITIIASAQETNV